MSVKRRQCNPATRRAPHAHRHKARGPAAAFQPSIGNLLAATSRRASGTDRRERPTAAKHDAAAKGFSALKVATHLRPAFVKRAESGRRIERNARAIAALIHARDAIVFDGQRARDVIDQRIEGHHEMTAFATAGTGGEIVEQERHSIGP